MAVRTWMFLIGKAPSFLFMTDRDLGIDDGPLNKL